jgi:hypothetical protein
MNNFTLTNRALLVRLSISQWTAKKLDKKAGAEVAANHGSNEDWGRYNKSLVAGDAVKKYQAVANDARALHYQHTLPWNDAGDRIVLASHYVEYTRLMREKRELWENEVSAFYSNYAALVGQARIELNGLFNDADYPVLAKIQKAFSWSIDTIPIPDQADFRVDLDRDLVSALQSDLQQKTTSLTDSAMRDVWSRLHNAVSHAVDRLSAPDAIFRDSLIENISEIVELLPALNLTGDANLDIMASEIKNKLLGVSAGELRENKAVRSETAARAAEIMAKMQDYMC